MRHYHLLNTTQSFRFRPKLASYCYLTPVILNSLHIHRFAFVNVAVECQYLFSCRIKTLSDAANEHKLIIHAFRINVWEVRAPSIRAKAYFTFIFCLFIFFCSAQMCFFFRWACELLLQPVDFGKTGGVMWSRWPLIARDVEWRVCVGLFEAVLMFVAQHSKTRKTNSFVLRCMCACLFIPFITLNKIWLQFRWIFVLFGLSLNFQLGDKHKNT